MYFDFDSPEDTRVRNLQYRLNRTSWDLPFWHDHRDGDSHRQSGSPSCYSPSLAANPCMVGKKEKANERTE